MGFSGGYSHATTTIKNAGKIYSVDEGIRGVALAYARGYDDAGGTAISSVLITNASTGAITSSGGRGISRLFGIPRPRRLALTAYIPTLAAPPTRRRPSTIADRSIAPARGFMAGRKPMPELFSVTKAEGTEGVVRRSPRF